MPESKPCVLIEDSEEATSDWIYVGAYPFVTVKSPTPKQVGTAKAAYVWMRAFKARYTCSCGGKTTEITVVGNLEYKTIKDFDAVYTVQTVSVGLPFPGALGALADVLGASLDLAIYWVNQELPVIQSRVNQFKPSDSDEGDKRVYHTTPVAVCGSKIKIGDGLEIKWPEEGKKPVIEKPAPSYIELDCPSSVVKKGFPVAMGTGTTKKACAKNTLANLDKAKQRGVKAASEVLARHRCKAPCIRIPQFKFKFILPKKMLLKPAAGAGLPPVTAPDGEPLINWTGFIYFRWEMTISCDKPKVSKPEGAGTGSGGEEGTGSEDEGTGEHGMKPEQEGGMQGEYKCVSADSVLEPVYFGDEVKEHVLAVERARERLITEALEEALISVALDSHGEIETPWCEITEEEPIYISAGELGVSDSIRGAVSLNWALYSGDEYDIEGAEPVEYGPYEIEIIDDKDESKR